MLKCFLVSLQPVFDGLIFLRLLITSIISRENIFTGACDIEVAHIYFSNFRKMLEYSFKSGVFLFVQILVFQRKIFFAEKFYNLIRDNEP